MSGDVVEKDATGSPSLAGWFYQADVSVWAALDLLLVKNQAAAIQLEPANQDDIEAELDAPVAASNVCLSSTLLIVQAKLRRSGHWTPSLLKSVVEHGKRRPSAVERLADARVRYVLVTSADVCKELQPLLVEDFIESPGADSLPASVFDTPIAQDAAGRFSVLGLHSAQRVKERIELMLMNPLSVPVSKLAACRLALRDAAMAGMCTGRIWQRNEVAQVIRDHGGVIRGDLTPKYVEPDSWGEMIEQMLKRHAILLVGPSGTGKTTTAKEIIAYLQNHYGGLNLVVAGTPAAIRECRHEGPTVFYLDDPWGKYDLSGTSFEWTSALVSFLLSANPRQLFVITTRSDIFREAAGDAEDFQRWARQLTARDYSQTQRQDFYKHLVTELSGGTLRTAAVQVRDAVLKQLKTPFELERFFKHLAPGPSADDRNESALIGRVLASTLRDAIEVEVKNLIEQRKDVHWAAVLWGLLVARDGFERAELPDIRRKLSRLDPVFFKDGLEALLNVLLAGDNLRQPTSRISYAHPRVELGLLSAMQAQPEIAEDALASLLHVLASNGAPGDIAGAEAAACVYVKMVEKTQWHIIPQAAQAGIDHWIEHALSAQQVDYRKLFKIATVAGSSDSMPAEVMRWLAFERRTGKKKMLYTWDLPERPAHWYELVRASPFTRQLCAGFITSVLPGEGPFYPTSMAESMDLLAEDLQSAWSEAALSVVGEGHSPNCDALAFGAMRSARHREVILVAAVNDLRSVRSYIVEDHIIQEEDDLDDDSQYPDDEGAASDTLCFAYVSALRSEGQWTAIATSPFLPDLIDAWRNALISAPTAPNAEVIAYFEAAQRLDSSSAWTIAEKHWQPEFEDIARSLLRSGHPRPHAGSNITRCAALNVPQILQEEFALQVAQGTAPRALEILFDACDMRFYGLDKIEAAYAEFISHLPPQYAELASVLTLKEPADPPLPLSKAAVDLALSGVLNCRGALQARLLRAIVQDTDVPSDIVCSVAASHDAALAIHGLHAAKARQLWDVVDRALTHPRGAVRIAALELLIAQNGGVIIQPWLCLARDRSGRVRRALAEALLARPVEFAYDTLIVLCRDEWSTVTYYYDTYPVARAAAGALRHMPVIADADVEYLLAIAAHSTDSTVQEHLYSALLENAGPLARAAVAEIAFGGDGHRKRVVAMWAIATSGMAGPMEKVEQLTSAWLLAAEPVLAAWAAAALGRRASAGKIEQLAQELVASADRRVLLIAIAQGLSWNENQALCQWVLDCLPSAHAARGLIRSEVALPSEILDDLGEAEMVDHVRGLCGKALMPRRAIGYEDLSY